LPARFEFKVSAFIEGGIIHMSTTAVEAPVEASGSMPNEAESIIEKFKTQDLSGFEALEYLRALEIKHDEGLRVYSRFIEVVQTGDSNFERDKCESCGRWITETGGYRLQGLPGIYHDRFCLEQGIFYKDDPHRGGSKDAHLGSGKLLRSYLAELSEKEPANPSSGVCAHCRGTLIGCRAGAKYCSQSCRQMAHVQASRTAKKPIKNPIKPGGYPSINPEVSVSGQSLQ
jgi:hypothetical protein